MNEYTASNGIEFYRDETGDLTAKDARDNVRFCIESGLFEDAFREFFRAEENERLGRWRWPDNPDYVVYGLRRIGLEGVKVIHETDGYQQTFADRAEAVKRPGSIPAQAAVAYFDAHPEPKPWHDAKPGEVWALTVDGEESAFYPSKSLDRAFTPVAPETGRTAVSMESFEITAGRRIYPEVTE